MYINFYSHPFKQKNEGIILRTEVTDRLWSLILASHDWLLPEVVAVIT